jgi:hypothetical protein
MKLLRIDKDHRFSNYNIALFTVVFMNIQILPIEGWPISIPKVVFMALSPIILLTRAPGFSKAIAWSITFWIITVGMSVIQFGATRMSTFYYSALFLFVFCMYYNLVYVYEVFDIDEFIDIIKFLILAYFVCLVLQELSFIVGLRKNVFVNMMGQRYYELFRLNSLGIEPSSSARTLAVCFYALLKCTEYKLGEPPSMRYLYDNYRIVVIGFLYTMIAMGSGTAMVCLAILSLYFMKRQYAFFALVCSLILYNLIPLLDYTPLNRAMNVMNATMTGDSEIVTKTDHSAATRVNIILDTFKYLDLSDPDMWLGKGIDATANESHAAVSGIVDYGLISYFTKIGMFLSCCFTSLFSIEVLMYILIFGLNIGNIAYGWGCLMIFATIKYFKYQYN